MQVVRVRSLMPLVALVAIAAVLLVLLAAPLRFELPDAALAPLPVSDQPLSATDRLIVTYQDRVRQDATDATSAAVLGLAYLQKVRESGDPAYYARAEAAIDRALRHDPENLDALIGSGQLALSRHQFREALATGIRAQARYPHVPRVLGIIADAQIELGMYPQAIETIQAMVDLRPDLSSYSRVAYARELHGDPAGAIEAMQRAVAAGGPSIENTEWTRVQLGQLYFATGDLAGAEAQYRLALARMPGYVYATTGLARVRAAQGRFDEALALYAEASARLPLPEVLIAYAETLQAAGRHTEADQQVALVRTIQQLFRDQGVDTDLELALFEADYGDPGVAVSLAQQAYQHRPSIKAAETLAWALYRAGRPAEAQPHIAAALQLGTRDALLHYHTGMIAAAAGDRAAAHRHLQTALEINPYFSLAGAAEARRQLLSLAP